MSEVDGRIVVFAGPSLPPNARPADDILLWRPPAAAGDIFALAGSSPRVVVVIDGLFDSTLSLRHKELLELMERGVTVIGGASMGALRAAELHTLGMVGVGRIFHAYVGGTLVADDEVALIHFPEDGDWAPLSEPLVNVRATLLAAVRARVIRNTSARATLSLAASFFYKERRWPEIFSELSRAENVDPEEADRLKTWLPEGRVDLKRIDALACLEAARGFPSAGCVTPRIPRTVFSETLRLEVERGFNRARAFSAPLGNTDPSFWEIEKAHERRSSG